VTKFVLGIAVGYLFSDVIDELISKASTGVNNVSTSDDTSTTTTEETAP
jgi:hypothetical protein